jgi:agmatinase
VPVDMSVGMRGAAFGPRHIRADERVLPHVPGIMINPDTRVKPFEVLNVYDYGDAPVDPLSIENSHEPIRRTVREILETGAVPIVLGGDHSILWPNGAAVADVYGAGNVGVIHFDTHVDCAPTILGHLNSHGSPIRRLIEDEHIPAENFVQVGLHSFVVPSDELLDWMRDRGMHSHHMAEIERIGFQAVLEKAIAEALDGPKYLYISLDIDVLDPAFAPGTGTPEPGGLTPRELLPAIRRLCHETPVIGFEVVEVAPLLDPTYLTAMYARRAILEALSGIAQRKLGLPTPNYLHAAVSGEPAPF